MSKFYLSFILFLLISLHPQRGYAESADDYIDYLISRKNDRSLAKVTDDFRSRLSSDEDGTLIQGLLREPKIVSFLYYNQHCAPEKYHLSIISEMLADEKYWGGEMSMKDPSDYPAGVIKRILPTEGQELKDLNIALTRRQHRRTIHSILCNLSDAIERDPSRSEELKKVAIGKIVQVIYTPTQYPHPQTTEYMRENTPPDWKPLEDPHAKRRELSLNRDVPEKTGKAEEPSGVSAWVWSGLVTLCLALAGFVIFRMPAGSRS